MRHGSLFSRQKEVINGQKKLSVKFPDTQKSYKNQVNGAQLLSASLTLAVTLFLSGASGSPASRADPGVDKTLAANLGAQKKMGSPSELPIKEEGKSKLTLGGISFGVSRRV